MTLASSTAALVARAAAADREWNRTDRVAVKVSPAEKTLLRTAAAAAGLTLSELMRQSALSYAEALSEDPGD